MTFKAHLNKINILVVLALLAALFVPIMAVAASQTTVAFNELFESDSADNAHTNLNTGTAIACSCGDPGGSGGGGGGCC